MKTLFWTALFISAAAQAATSDVPRLVSDTVMAQPSKSSGSKSSDDEDEEEEAPVKTPTPTTPKPKPKPAEAPQTTAPQTAPKEAAPAEATAPNLNAPEAAVANPASQRLVGGAPLADPNVAVHIVERKTASDRGRSELVLYPATPQINGKFTQHYGSALSFVYHLQENFAFQVNGQYNWYSAESDFNQQLINNVREQAQAATSLLMVWGALAGVEVSPLYGKFAYYEGRLGHFSFVINAAAGLADTRLQLRSANDAGPDTFGDAGLKFMGQVGAGFRVSLGDHFALRLEVRDLVYTARVDSIDGCNSSDLQVLDNWFHSHPTGQGIGSVSGLSGSCNTAPFSGQVAQNSNSCSGGTGYCYNKSSDIPLAYNLVQSPSSDVLNNVGFYLGISYLF